MRNNKEVKNRINATKIELPQNKSLSKNEDKPKEIRMKLSDFRELKSREDGEKNKQQVKNVTEVKISRKNTDEKLREKQKRRAYNEEIIKKQRNDRPEVRREKPKADRIDRGKGTGRTDRTERTNRTDRTEKEHYRRKKRKKRSYTEELEEIRIRKRMVNYVTGILILIFLITGIVIATGFSIEDMEVTGNVHYNKEEIVDIVTADGYIDNALLLYFKNKIKPIENVPFVDKLDIEYVSNHKITVTIYEKAMAGCIEYMDEYVYFDKEGIVLEMSNRKMEDVPCIKGMTFDAMTLHSKLPIEDTKRFKLILNITQLLDKYELNIDSVRFTSDDEIILNYNNIKILLGKGENIDAQLVDLGNILEKLEGRKGTLNMKDFTDSKKIMTFKADE